MIECCKIHVLHTLSRVRIMHIGVVKNTKKMRPMGLSCATTQEKRANRDFVKKRQEIYLAKKIRKQKIFISYCF